MHGEVFSVAITPDGTRAVSGGDDATVRVWDLATGSERAVLAGHTRPVWSVAITPDGARAASGGGDGTVRVWDLATGHEQAALTGHARRGLLGGDHPGRHPRRQRRRRRDRADLGPEPAGPRWHAGPQIIP